MGTSVAQAEMADGLLSARRMSDCKSSFPLGERRGESTQESGADRATTRAPTGMGIPQGCLVRTHTASAVSIGERSAADGRAAATSGQSASWVQPAGAVSNIEDAIRQPGRAPHQIRDGQFNDGMRLGVHFTVI